MIQAKDTDWGVVEAIKHTCTSGKVVQLLCQIAIPGVKNHTENPAGESHIAERNIESPQRVLRRYAITDLAQAILVCQEVEERKQHRKRLLYAEEAVERPFPMILYYWL